MALGWKDRLGRLESELSPDNRYIDIAFELEIYDRDIRGKLVSTGQKSEVFGGRWDKHILEWAGEPRKILTLKCSHTQFELVTCDSERIEGGGGRGGGKTKGGGLWSLKQMVESPMGYGRIIAPTYQHVWTARNKLMEFIPYKWLIQKSILSRPYPEFTLWTGHNVQFRSTKDPDGLRGWDGSWILSDEDQKSSTYAGEVAWLCLRHTDTPKMLRTLTPAGGEALQRHDDNIKDKEVKVFSFSGYSNPFMSHRAMDVMRKSMHPDTYKVEVEADWETVRKIEDQGRLTKVFSWFSPEVHGLNLEDLMGPEWARFDITAKVLKSVTGRKGGNKIRYIAGVDPNYHAPNSCTIYKVYSGLRSGDPDRWVVVDYLERNGSCEQLARSLRKVGYHPADTVIVMDASGRYNKLNSEKASYKLMKKEGFNVLLMKSDRGNRNPHVRQSVDDVITKMDPVGDRSLGWFIVVRDKTQALIENIMGVEWNADGTRFNRTPRPDPVDSMRYPVSYFAPVDKRENMWAETA